jgi:nitric oxide reductase subunit C
MTQIIAVGSIAEHGARMLSKSQAKWFFLLGTGAFSAVFLGLTVDSMAQVPERSHEAAMSASVVRGKLLWDRNNCMGCHTLLGEGAYYAPELTKVYTRRGPDWMRAFLRDPNAMFPGERKMVRYPFTDTDIDDLVAFFAWIGNVDTNDFPPKPDLAPPTAAQAPTTTSAKFATAPATFKTICVACHSVDGQGGKVGPALDAVAGKYDDASLDRWLADPQAVKPGTAMPNLKLAPDVRKELVGWLLGK